MNTSKLHMQTLQRLLRLVSVLLIIPQLSEASQRSFDRLVVLEHVLLKPNFATISLLLAVELKSPMAHGPGDVRFPITQDLPTVSESVTGINLLVKLL